jgi:hypothetical protein
MSSPKASRPGTRHPVAPQRDAEAQDLLGRVGVAGRVLGVAAQIRLLGVQPRKPADLSGPVRCGAIWRAESGGIK